jgi:hypothetical protein
MGTVQKVLFFFVLPSVLSFVLPSNPSFVLPSDSEASLTSLGTTPWDVFSRHASAEGPLACARGARPFLSSRGAQAPRDPSLALGVTKKGLGCQSFSVVSSVARNPLFDNWETPRLTPRGDKKWGARGASPSMSSVPEKITFKETTLSRFSKFFIILRLYGSRYAF